ncbi:MAG TPA: TIM barrel protein [Terriglobales bacterium]|nr:TIM barrel protein [Terriglobales bacterium]
MRRRAFLHSGAGALLGLAATRGLTAHAAPTAFSPFAQEGVSSPRAGKLKVDVYSRHLQWLRTADEVAEAAIEMAYNGVDITVRPYPGHVDPARVKTDLPPFVNTIRRHGLQVVTITCPITDADSPHAEEILQTAADLGIHHYWWGTFRYAPNQPILPQLDALKPRVAKLAALNAKYGMTAMYHTYSGPVTVGAGIWDLLHVLRNFDPKQVGFHYDSGHMVIAGGGGTWEMNLRAAAPYIAGLSVKDYVIEPTLVVNEGGPMPAAVAARLGQPRGRRGRGGGRGRGRGAPEAAPPEQGEPLQAGLAGAAGEGRGGRGTGPGRGGRGGRGRGGFGGMKPGWRERAVPLNTGMVDLPTLAAILKEINFSGPVEIQSEYPNGGAESARDHLSLPRAIVLGNMKRDLLALRMEFGPSGLLDGALSAEVR